MSNNFEDFLMDSFEETQETEREVTLGGKKKLMKFKPISADIGDKLRKKNRKIKFVKGQRIMETDQDKYVSDLIIETTTCPDLKNSKLQASWGVMGAEELLYAMKVKMKDGEFSEWSTIVSEVNGYDKSVSELVEEAKDFVQGGDGEAAYAHYALHKLKILPHELMNLSRQEKAFIYASIDLHVEKENKEAKRLKSKR